MADNSGRRGSVEIPEIVRAPAWRRVLDWSREELLHRLGQPAGLERVGVRLENGKYPTLRLFAVQIDVDSA